ncbi:acetyl-/propionyl-CoA carboxylase epsilon subunit [Nocardia nova SH22a]|uniref:Acetyl-/propionyl-CoA carboxylase epsilon subunit n=1 Tax=Nocardia nova SH22a TaxID=1415166 RepID=W5TAF5_9NOCA|nr:acyl-CoA carboxylase subunit epsilon [Nocardia nova]AHH15953.1 acetyl-/propionyl-CoA carboxylase epsilon subunit [Nocardia nova SH22a]
MTAVADEEILRAAELDLAVDGFGDDAKLPAEPAAEPEPDRGPLVRVLKGSPTDAELAALITVFAAAAGSGAPEPDPGPVDNWGRPTMMHRGASPFSPYAYPYVSHLRG